MNRILDAVRRFLSASRSALSLAYSVSLRWLSVPVNLCVALLGAVFVISLASWTFAEPFERALLYFPDSRGVLHGEVRDVPHAWGTEAKAALIAAEVLLGPKSSDLQSAFPTDIRVESAMFRKGRLYIDVSGQAAADPDTLKIGLKAMRQSLRAALPLVSRITLTVGGQEPFVQEKKMAEGGPAIKKAGK